MAFFGAFYYGGPCKWLYMGYERFLGPGKIVLKTFLDVYIHLPFVVIPTFYAVTGTLAKGQPPAEIFAKLKAEWVTVSLGSFCFWTPTMVVAFKCVVP